MRWALALLAVLGSTPAGAVSLLLEGSAARQFTSVSLMGEVELVKDRTFLTGCFGSTRSAPVEITAGVDQAAVNIPRSTQGCLGLDHGFDDHWRVSVMASLSPKVISQVEVVARPSVVYRSETANAGASLGVSYDSAGLEDVQWGVDLGLSANRYTLSHEWITAIRTFPVPATLSTLRPSAGVLVALGDVELQLRASYTFYSQDPLMAGAVTEEELGRVADFVQRLVTASQLFGVNVDYGARLQQAGTRVMAIDAISGLATAPVKFELRPSVQYRFTGWLRGQVGYTYDRYVPGAGYAHVASTKWTLSFWEHLQTWAAASVQLDVPGSAPSQIFGILTLGVEVSF
jgi:hypothetical protein